MAGGSLAAAVCVETDEEVDDVAVKPDEDVDDGAIKAAGDVKDTAVVPDIGSLALETVLLAGTIEAVFDDPVAAGRPPDVAEDAAVPDEEEELPPLWLQASIA